MVNILLEGIARWWTDREGLKALRQFFSQRMEET